MPHGLPSRSQILVPYMCFTLPSKLSKNAGYGLSDLHLFTWPPVPFKHSWFYLASPPINVVVNRALVATEHYFIGELLLLTRIPRLRGSATPNISLSLYVLRSWTWLKGVQLPCSPSCIVVALVVAAILPRIKVMSAHKKWRYLIMLAKMCTHIGRWPCLHKHSWRATSSKREFRGRYHIIMWKGGSIRMELHIWYLVLYGAPYCSSILKKLQTRVP